MKPILYLISSMLFLIVCICSCSTREEPPPPVETEMPKKLTQFTFMDRCSEEDGLLAEIHNDMKGRATILDLMKFYSDELAKDVDINSPYFQKLQRIFDCGITPETMSKNLFAMDRKNL